MKISLFASVLVVCTCFAAPPAIGTIGGTAEITDGAALTTASTPSDIHLASGVDVRLSPRSHGVIYSDHVVLDNGSVRVGHFPGYAVTAGQFQIQSDSPATQAVVRINAATVEVASLSGDVRVSDGGAMLTRVIAGTRVSFQQSGASTGASVPYKKLPSDRHVMYWIIGITAAAALAIGLTAAAQGKSPF
ncbi:MAG TPA: hypothetical protein VHZ55_21675 [Bryobacteraceae bacterium]|nr:hypothetical protein [Bryobacteraceae bacterium]